MKKLFLIILATLLFAAGMQAQYKVLLTFNDTNGANPTGSLILSGNTLYGVASRNIFSINTDGSGYKVLSDSISPNSLYSSLILSGTTLYGVSGPVGSYSEGLIFSIQTNGTGYNVLHNFWDTNGTGSGPVGSLTLSGNVLYGMTEGGGSPSGYGTIFSIKTDGSGYNNMFVFNYTNGAEPTGSLTLSGNKLYGMTSWGGTYASGTVFSIDTDGSNFKVLLIFNNDTSGAVPHGSLTLSGNTLYGMTLMGGASDDGNIFSIDTNGSGFNNLLFLGYNQTGAAPEGSLTLSGNVLYGMAAGGGVIDFGTIFSINPDGSGYKDLYDFQYPDDSSGVSPWGDLTLSGNVFYGMTSSGGAAACRCGTIFSFKVVGLGIDSISANSGALNVYPNPSNGKFIIQLSGVGGGSQVVVYNVFGQKVYSQFSAVNSSFTIDLSTQPAGLYLYRVITQEGALIGSGKVILQ